MASKETFDHQIVGKATFLYNVLLGTFKTNNIDLVTLIKPNVVKMVGKVFLTENAGQNNYACLGKQLKLIPVDFVQTVTPEDIADIPFTTFDRDPKNAIKDYQTLLCFGHFFINLGFSIASNLTLSNTDQQLLNNAAALTNLGATFWLGAEKFLRPYAASDYVNKKNYLPPDIAVDLAEKILQVRKMQIEKNGKRYEKLKNEDSIVDNLFDQIMLQLCSYPDLLKDINFCRRVKRIIAQTDPKKPEAWDLLFFMEKLPPLDEELDYQDFLFKAKVLWLYRQYLRKLKNKLQPI